MKIKRLLEFASASIISLSTVLAFGVPFAHAAGQTCTWTGAGANNKFSTVANWSNCLGAAPTSGDNLVFPFSNVTTTNFALDNDIAGASYPTLTFLGATNTAEDSYSFSGLGLTITTSIVNTGTSTATGNATVNFTLPVSLGASLAVSVVDTASLVTLSQPLTGAAGITETGGGGLILNADNSAYTGAIIVNSGTLIASTANSLGTASAPGATVNNGADIILFACNDLTLNGNITLTGNSSVITGDFPNPKLGTYITSCAGSGGAVSDEYGNAKSSGNATFGGHLTLGSDTSFASVNATTTILGALSGNFKINFLPGYFGKLVVASSANTSGTANGTYASALFSKTLSDSLPNKDVTIYSNNAITIDGTRKDTRVLEGGLLYGTGTLGALIVDAASTVAPGHSPGCLTASSLALSGTYQAEIGGVTPCSEYDQIKVLTGGTVNVTDATLDVKSYQGFVPKVGQSYTIVDNQSPSTTAVVGSFKNLTEGATLVKDGVSYVITYKGGDGNDIVLTVKADAAAVAVPAKPDTGFVLVAAQSSVVLAVTSLAAGILLLAARKLRPSVK